MATVKEELEKVVKELSEEERGIILKFARWLRDQEETLTDQELAILSKGERQVRNGDFVWWRDVRRTKV